jgi:hypothetical protein
MAKLVALWQAGAAIRIGQAEAADLARFGITSITLLRSDRVQAVAFDGWAFDPRRDTEAVLAAVSEQPPATRLLAVADIGVTNAVLEGGPR